MIIKLSDLKKKNNDKIFYYLLYGPNQGLIEDTIDNFLKPFLTKNLFIYDENQILENKSDFIENLYTKSFFENEKLIIINRASDKILELIEDVFEKETFGTSIIIKSGNLDKKSKLRNFFDKNKNTYSIACYMDNHQSLSFLANEFFKKEKIKISTQSINLIIERSKGDRINLKNELNKIKEYSKNKKQIEFEEIVKLTNLSNNYDISEIVDNCLSKNKKRTILMLNENTLDEDKNILILKSFLYKLKRLKKLKKQIMDIKNVEHVLSNYRPIIFWKDKDILKQQLKTLTLIEINETIDDVNNLELLVKKNLGLSSLLVENFILEKVN